MCRWIASQEGSLIDLTNKIFNTSCDIVMQTSLGNKSNELAKFISIVRETSDLVAGFYAADFFPSIKLISLFGRMRGRAERLHKICDEILENIINDHRVSDHERKDREDLVDVLLKFNEHGHKLFLTTDNIKAVIQDIFNAGIETSSTTTDWAMVELLKHPNVMKKAQDEVRVVFNDEGFVDESKFEELKYLKLVIKETLRMHPPAPLLIPRESSEHCKILQFDIPVKTRVMVNVWALGRDPKHWKDPNCFIPDRYLDSSIDFKGGNFEYLPFGGGRRICPGMSLGLANVELPLAMLLYHFDWVLPDGIDPESLDMMETFGVTARRKDSLHVIPMVARPLVVK